MTLRTGVAAIFGAAVFALAGCAGQTSDPEPAHSIPVMTTAPSTESSPEVVDGSYEPLDTTDEFEPAPAGEPVAPCGDAVSCEQLRSDCANGYAAPGACEAMGYPFGVDPPAGKVIERCGTPGLHETGTTFYTDGSSGWTQTCADQMSG